MDGQGLSRRELRILAEIENELRADGRLDRALSTMRRGPGWVLGRTLRAALHVAGCVPASVLSVLLALSAGLAVVSADAHSPDVLAAFGLVWAPTLVLTAARLLAWRRRTGR